MHTHTGFTPHGPRFRFVDTFERYKNTAKGLASFHLCENLWFFKEHFPGNPVMPAALLMECAAQASGILWMSLSTSIADATATPLFVAAVEQLRVHGPGLPEDTLQTEVELLKEFGSLAQFQFETSTSRGPVMRGRITLSRELKAPN